MSHLSTDRLAALADEQPMPDEAGHLATCAECARELAAYRALLALAREEGTSMRLPLTRWDSLAPALRADGLVSAPPSTGSALFGGRRLLQVAAALLLVAGGATLGRMSVVVAAPDGASQVAERTDRLDTLRAFTSIEEAMRMRELYRDGYQRAVTYLAQQDSGRDNETPAAMKARLAALDRVWGITREAMKSAPFDPVLNDFYLNSHSQREATLRELNTVLPQNVRLSSY